MATIERLGRETGYWDTVLRTDTEILTKKKLEYNAKNLERLRRRDVFIPAASSNMDEQQKADFISFIHDDGKGFIGVHSAAITFSDWPEYGDMIGGYFDEHPWSTFDAPIIVEDPRLSRHVRRSRTNSCCTTRSTSSKIIRATKSACSCASIPRSST